ncbi:TfoX/Sxy family protein [Pseudooceanicola sp. MF1-13]|uniref:TfoX/Sxy family protein n=1 Tax=Pseudooceanicola sp. MF1-13 TaxID=3379095 RepID=UPI00389258FF
MAVSDEVLEHALDLFRTLGPIRTGRMFSGAALYVEDDVMFAMIASSGTIYMKSDATTEQQFLDAGSEPFTYTRATGDRQVTSLMSLPDSALDDADEAHHWAQLSLGPARVAADKKRADKARKAARKAT